MNEKYYRLWRLLQERVATESKNSERYSVSGEIYAKMLSDMAILEAEAVLED